MAPHTVLCLITLYFKLRRVPPREELAHIKGRSKGSTDVLARVEETQLGEQEHSHRIQPFSLSTNQGGCVCLNGLCVLVSLDKYLKELNVHGSQFEEQWEWDREFIFLNLKYLPKIVVHFGLREARIAQGGGG